MTSKIQIVAHLHRTKVSRIGQRLEYMTKIRDRATVMARAKVRAKTKASGRIGLGLR